MSKKEEAFELFSQGKRPSSPEVKGLGLSAKTRYNYYQEWKRSSELMSDSVDLDEIKELKAEKARLVLLTQIDELEAKRAKLPNQVARLEKQFVTLIDWLKEQNMLIGELVCILRTVLGFVEWTLPEEEIKEKALSEIQKAEAIYGPGNKELDQIKEGIRWL